MKADQAPASVDSTLWEEALSLFAYDEPREAQLDGMKQVLESVGDNGFFVLEGPCGTGKTMLCLPPLAALVRSKKSQLDRIVVATSVKQQQRAFEEEIRAINEGRDDEDKISAVTVVGKKDMNPYSRHGDINPDNVFTVDEQLRENTRRILDDADNPKSKADELASMAADLDTVKEWADGSPNYPYPPFTPATADGIEFSPFYAKYTSLSFEDGETSTIPFDVSNMGLMTADELVNRAGTAGIAPHSVMTDVMNEVEIVIANYNHIFDPQTVQQLTSEIIDSGSALVCDEAHNLVHRVQKLFSEDISTAAIRDAKDEVEQIQQLLDSDLGKLEQAKGIDLDQEWRQEQLDEQTLEEASKAQSFVNDDNTLPTSITEYIEYANLLSDLVAKNSEFSRDDLNQLVTVFEDVLEFVDRKVTEALIDEFGEYWGSSSFGDSELEVPLRDPEKITQDEMTQFLSLKQQLGSLSNIDESGAFVAHLLDVFYEEIRESDELRDFAINPATRVLHSWYWNDYKTFFREIIIEPAERGRRTGPEWEKEFNVSLEMKNCLPSERIAERVSEFGGGVFMSATLEPLDVFKEVTGISTIEDRPIVQQKYGLNFPERNRASIAVDATPFKKSNRGDPFDYDGEPRLNSTRKEYKTVVLDALDETEGNVLVAMPSYQEAQWIGEIVKSETRRDVFVDKSSANSVTTELKEDFFESSNGVLVTGARGTLVEGVDYEGDKLNGAIVCGIPIENPYQPYQKAIRTAYDDRFGGEDSQNGFRYAFTIPAVQKARQAIGRVIRSDEDRGFRMLVDARYTDESRWDTVRDIIPNNEWEEFDVTEPEYAGNFVKSFWKYQSEREE